MSKEIILDRLISIKSVLSYIEILCKEYDELKEDCNKHIDIDIIFFKSRLEQIDSNKIEQNIKFELDSVEKEIVELNLQRNKDIKDIEKKNFLVIKDSRYYDKIIVDKINILMELSIKDEIKDIDTALDELNNKEKYLREMINKRNDDAIIIRKSYEDAIDTINKLVQIKTQEMDLLLKKIQTIFNDLCKSEKDFLHQNDFDKLERIYFYIVTGRADNIRDALNLADTQIRHEELVEVIKQAVSSICTAINTATNEIIDAIRENTEQICESINSSAELINNGLLNIDSEIKKLDDNVTKGILKIIDNQKEIVDSNLLHTSLLKEQNNTCENILKHYRHVNGMSGDL